jgi:hypothetical protein
MSEATLPQAEVREKPAVGSWRYFWSIIRYSGWVYTGIVLMRLFIFAATPQLTGLVMREFKELPKFETSPCWYTGSTRAALCT